MLYNMLWWADYGVEFITVFYKVLVSEYFVVANTFLFIETLQYRFRPVFF